MPQPRDYATELRIEEHALERVLKQYAQGTIGHSAVSRQEQRVAEARAALAKSKEGPQMDSATKLDAACAKLDSLARKDDGDAVQERYRVLQNTSTEKLRQLAGPGKESAGWRELLEIIMKKEFSASDLRAWTNRRTRAAKDAAPATKLDAACAKVDALVRKDGVRQVKKSVLDKKTRDGEWEVIQEATRNGYVQIKNLSSGKTEYIQVEELRR